MRKFLFLITLTMFAAGALSSEESEQNGVKVSVEKAADSIKGFKAFKVVARNTSSGPRSLNMKIYLNDRNRKEPAGAQGECTVFMNLEPGASKSEVKQCKETGTSNDWSIQIIKVYEFLTE
jgi:hypothetical protein